jgi:polar amino acid transport system substrate-binding protein
VACRPARSRRHHACVRYSRTGASAFSLIHSFSISPSSEPQVFDTSNDVVTALKQEQVDAIVVDVPTAFYLTAVQVPEAEIVGQFSAPGGDEWGALLEKGSPLTDCVSFAIDSLRESGELGEIEQEWISEKADAPVLE